MKLGTIVLIIIGLIFAAYYFTPDLYEDYKGKTMSFVSGMFDDEDPKVQENIRTTDNETFSRGEDLEDEKVIIQNPDINNQENLCGKQNYGKPDYEGTTLEGLGCDEFYGEEADLTCLSNTPTNYDGIILLGEQYSNPVITCCLEDGTCQW